MKEIWKDIKWYEGQYIVSNLGNVRSLDRYVNTYHGPRICLGQPLKQYIGHDGYLHVALSKRKKHKRIMAHRLVAEAFIPNPDNKPQVNHIDGDKQNNCVDNLEWCTASENQLHSVRILKHKPYKIPSMFGVKHWRSKVVLQIKEGKIIAEFYGTREAKRKTKIDDRSIGACCRGERKTAGGYEWKYK